MYNYHMIPYLVRGLIVTVTCVQIRETYIHVTSTFFARRRLGTFPVTI